MQTLTQPPLLVLLAAAKQSTTTSKTTKARPKTRDPSKQRSTTPKKRTTKTRKRTTKTRKRTAKTRKPKKAPRRSIGTTLWRLKTFALIGFAASLVAVATLTVHTSAQTNITKSLNAGTYVLVDRLTTEIDSPTPGNVVLVRSHIERQHTLLARVYAHEGDTLDWRAGSLRLNGHAVTLPAPLARIPLKRVEKTQEQRRSFPLAVGLPEVPYTVPRHHVYIITDTERGRRILGRVVPEGDILGIARFALTNIQPDADWQQRLPRPIR